MNKKKILIIALTSAISIGSLVGCGNTDKKELSKKENKVSTNNSKKNEKIKEETTKEVTEESTMEMAIDGFKKYFNIELKKEDCNVYEAHLSSEYETEHFVVSSNELVKLPYEEWPKYYSEVETKTGEIRIMSSNDIKEVKDPSNFDVEKGKSIAIDFIKEHKLLDDDKIEYIDDLTDEEKELYKKEHSYYYNFKAENGKLVIRVNKADLKVSLFKFEQPVVMEE